MMMITMMLTIMIFLGLALQDGALGLPRLPKQPSPSLLDTLLLLLVLLLLLPLVIVIMMRTMMVPGVFVILNFL